VLASIALGVCFIVRRKKKKSVPLENHVIPSVDEKGPNAAMLDGASVFEADGKSVFKAELPETSEPVIAELSPAYEILELPGDTEYNTAREKT
jgi:hypothetical protein